MNKTILDLCGISAWHDIGFTGKLGMSATAEYFDKDLPALEGMVIDGRDTPVEKSSHGYQTAMVHRAVLPERRIVMLSIDKSGTDIEKIKDLRIDTIYKSQSASAKQPKNTPYDAVTGFCSMFTSAGNKGKQGYNRYMDSACWYGVGAVRLDKGKVVAEAYTSEHEEVDFSGFADVYIPPSSGDGDWYQIFGTSAACPFVAGQAGLVNELLLSKTGEPLTAAQMYAFLKLHRVDVDEEGRDIRTGWGYIKLPPPDKAERELFKLTRMADALYAEALGKVRHVAQYYIDLAKDWRLPDDD